MATAAKTVFPHITTDPDVCHGRPCIAGTRVRVMDIVAVHEQGVAPAERCRASSSFPSGIGTRPVVSSGFSNGSPWKRNPSLASSAS